jgi:hypothetical protein
VLDRVDTTEDVQHEGVKVNSTAMRVEVRGEGRVEEIHEHRLAASYVPKEVHPFGDRLGWDDHMVRRGIRGEEVAEPR